MCVVPTREMKSRLTTILDGSKFQKNGGCMAIGFARAKHIKRSEGKNMLLKSSYNGKLRLQFEGNTIMSGCTYDWSCRGKRENLLNHTILLPEHVDKSFSDPEHLWNRVEQFEKRKDAQVGMDFLLALPGDKIITNEQRVEITHLFAKKYFVSKGYGVQVDVHFPSHQKSYDKKSDDHDLDNTNFHAHMLITSRHFSKDGKTFSELKVNDLGPEVRYADHYTFDAMGWPLIWTQFQNEYFMNKGLDLRVDQPGAIAQIHLGPVRMRSKNAYSLLDLQNTREELNQLTSQDPNIILGKLTENKSVFTNADVETFLQKFVSDEAMGKTRELFWENSKIIQLYDKESYQPTDKFSSIEVIEEERKILRLSDRLYQNPALPSKNTITPISLNHEQRDAFNEIMNGKAISCIEGLAGTGKSHLLVALKENYESQGYRVRAFGPDNATVKVLQEKGFKDASSIHKFLFKNHFSKKKYISKGNEIWIIDEASKIANRPLLELLKAADTHNIQVVFAGNSAQLSSVERGGMFEHFCIRYGHAFLEDIQRQKNQTDREISKRLAFGDVSTAVDMISRTGGFNWCKNNEEALLKTVEKWAEDKLHFPYSTSMIIAHTNREVRQINDLVHTIRMARGEVSKKEFDCQTIFGNIRVSEGDLIEFRANSNKLFVNNGEKGVLISASENKFVVAIDNKKVIFNPKKYTSFQLGYSATCFRSQGVTLDFSYILYHSQMHQKLLYVGRTRHVHKAHCFVSETEASCISVLKKQVSRHTKGENTSNYATAQEIENLQKTQKREKNLQGLCDSDRLLHRLNGYGGKTWDYIKQNVGSFVTEIKDVRPNKGFYKVPEADLRSGVVFEVKEEKILNELQKDKSEAKLQVKKLRSPRSEAFQKLHENQRGQYRKYFEKSEISSTLQAIVESESTASSGPKALAPSFPAWQKACGERNLAAFELLRSGSNHTEILGQKGLEILKNRADRHDYCTQPTESIDVKLKENLEILLYRLFPDGPTRRDSRGFRFGNNGSLAVTCLGEKKGCYYNHENREGGGILNLIEKKMGLNKSEALEWACHFLNEPREKSIPSHFSTAKFYKTKEDKWISLTPPSGAIVSPLKTLSSYLDSEYRLISVYPYFNESGNAEFYTMRLEKKEDGKKIILPVSYGKLNQEDQPSWKIKRNNTKSGMLYNTHLLFQNPQKPILIVEGEKTADAAQNLLGNNYVVVTWLGGSSAAKDANWSQLFGKDVVIWPDNDSPGFKAASEIGVALRQVGVNSLKVVTSDILKDLPQKWDLADSLPDGKSSEFISDSLLRAESKSIGADRLSTLATQHGLTFKQLNEIICEIDNSMRDELEKKHGSKTWEIDNAILSEASKCLREKPSLTDSKKNIEKELNHSKEHYAKSGGFSIFD